MNHADTSSSAPQLNVDTTTMWRDVTLYALARIGMFFVLWVIIAGLAMLVGAPVPLTMSALFALIVVFPLSFFMFRGLRARVTEQLAAWSAHRKAERAWVEKEIAGRED